MKPAWKSSKHLKPQVILEKIESIKILNPDGGVSFKGFEYHNSIAALYNMLTFPSAFTPLQNQSFLNSAISNVAKIGILGKENLLVELKNLYSTALAKREEEFLFLTSISVMDSFPFKEIEFGNCRIRIMSTDFPQKYQSRQEISVNVRRYHPHLELSPESYKKVIVSTKSKSSESAVNQCLNDLDVVRAVWSFFANSGMELLGDEWSPINAIRLGGIHTLHKKNGQIIDSGMYWFEPNFKIATPFRLSDRDTPLFKKNIKWMLQKLNLCRYSEPLQNALIRYVRALDERDQNVALIHLWGAIESLTAYEENNKSKLPIRCAFLFHEHEYHQQILEHLREYRNQSVHAGDKHERAKAYCYQLQFYFQQLIFFHLSYVDIFNSLSEANSFLDQDTNIEALKRKREMIDKAILFRGGE